MRGRPSRHLIRALALVAGLLFNGPTRAAGSAMVPASTAKIMTAEVVFHELKQGRLKLDDRFVVSEHAWHDGGARSGGSSSLLVVNSSVRVEDLLRGLVIQSGRT